MPAPCCMFLLQDAENAIVPHAYYECQMCFMYCMYAHCIAMSYYFERAKNHLISRSLGEHMRQVSDACLLLARAPLHQALPKTIYVCLCMQIAAQASKRYVTPRCLFQSAMFWSLGSSVSGLAPRVVPKHWKQPKSKFQSKRPHTLRMSLLKARLYDGFAVHKGHLNLFPQSA